MGDANRKLPRRPHADRPGPGEQVLKQGGADLQNGWLSRHGSLSVTEDRLVFVPTVLDTVLGAKRREIRLDDITEIERFPVSPSSSLAAGARRPRMILHTSECAYELMVGDLDGWIDSLERVYALRAKAGKPHSPTITRDDYVNLLLVEE